MSPLRPNGIRGGEAIPGQLIDVHGEHDGAIHQQVTLGRSDIPPVSLRAEDRADPPKCRINGKHSDHGSHLDPRDIAMDAWPGQGLWSSPRAALLPSIKGHGGPAGPTGGQPRRAVALCGPWC